MTAGAALRRNPSPRPPTLDLSAATATVTLRTTFEPLDPTGVDQLTAMVHGAFQQSLESLRRFVEDEIPWDAS